MPDNIDKAAEKFATAWLKAKGKVKNLYNAFISSNQPNPVLLQQIAQLDLTQLLLDDPALKKALQELTVAHVSTLKALTPFSQVDDAFLSALISLDQQVYVGQIGASAVELKALMGESITANLSESSFAKSLEATGLQKHQANALANDTLRKYERSVTIEMANNADPNKLFVWSGPLDSRTSQQCQVMIAAGPMTLAEWQSQFGGFIVSGTHVQCRHTLLPA